MRKTSQSFGVDDGLIYDPVLYDAQDNFAFDVPFYLELARKARGPVLELCCGTGRITIPLAKAGIDIVGLDFTPQMLDRAREKARQDGLNVAFINGDMRKTRLKRIFPLIFIPFNSIQNTYTLSDLERVFDTVHAHMTPNGRFAFDIFNPSIQYMVKHERIHKALYKFRTEDNRKVTIDQSCQYDAAAQVNRTTWRFHIQGRRTAAQKIDMRCFYPQEMDALLKYNGFKILKKYGNFKKHPFTSESMKQIYVCKIAS